MAYKFREEIVGKRFLSVSGFSKLKVNKISEWGWRAGVIRAASHRDNGCHDLQVGVAVSIINTPRFLRPRERVLPNKVLASTWRVTRNIDSVSMHAAYLASRATHAVSVYITDRPFDYSNFAFYRLSTCSISNPNSVRNINT